MQKILILSILLVIVYQFDELMRMLWFFVQKLRRKKYRQLVLDSDHYVGTAVTIAAMPLLLHQVLTSDQILMSKLMWLAFIYTSFAVVAYGMGAFVKRLLKARQLEGVAYAMSVAHTVGTVFHPDLHTMPWSAGRERLTYGKMAFLLSLPVFLGIAFKLFYNAYSYQEQYYEYLDTLIIVMIGGMFINITITALEKYFHNHDMNLLGYFRVALGIALAFFLIY